MKLKEVTLEKRKGDNLFFKEMDKINCYSTALAYVAKQEGLDLSQILQGLNFENNFHYDKYNKVFTSKKLIENLKNNGFFIRLEFCKYDKNIFQLKQMPKNTWFILGIDCYNAPWHALYKRRHATHYVPIFKQDNEVFLAYEPIYNKSNILLNPEIIENYAIEIKLILIIKKVNNKKDCKPSLKDLEKLDYQKNILVKKFKNYNYFSDNAKFKITKYVSELSSNRYLILNLLVNNGCKEEVVQQYKENIAKNWLNIKFGVARIFFDKNRLDITNSLIDLVYKVIEDEKEFLVNGQTFKSI